MDRNDRIIETLNNAINQLDKLRADLINESRTAKRSGKKNKKSAPTQNNETPAVDDKTIMQYLERYGQPTDSDHIESISKILQENSIRADQLDSCLERIKYANDKEPKNDIKKYTYGCLYKINRL